MRHEDRARVELAAPRRSSDGAIVLSANLTLATGDKVKLEAHIGETSQRWARDRGGDVWRRLQSALAGRLELNGDWSSLGELGLIARAVAGATARHEALRGLVGPCCASCAASCSLAYDPGCAAELPGAMPRALAQAAKRALTAAR